MAVQVSHLRRPRTVPSPRGRGRVAGRLAGRVAVLNLHPLSARDTWEEECSATPRGSPPATTSLAVMTRLGWRPLSAIAHRCSSSKTTGSPRKPERLLGVETRDRGCARGPPINSFQKKRAGLGHPAVVVLARTIARGGSGSPRPASAKGRDSAGGGELSYPAREMSDFWQAGLAVADGYRGWGSVAWEGETDRGRWVDARADLGLGSRGRGQPAGKKIRLSRRTPVHHCPSPATRNGPH